MSLVVWLNPAYVRFILFFSIRCWLVLTILYTPYSIQDGKTALMYAAQKGHVEIMDALIRGGSRTDLFDMVRIVRVLVFMCVLRLSSGCYFVVVGIGICCVRNCYKYSFGWSLLCAVRVKSNQLVIVTYLHRWFLLIVSLFLPHHFYLPPIAHAQCVPPGHRERNPRLSGLAINPSQKGQPSGESEKPTVVLCLCLCDTGYL